MKTHTLLSNNVYTSINNILYIKFHRIDKNNNDFSTNQTICNEYIINK